MRVRNLESLITFNILVLSYFLWLNVAVSRFQSLLILDINSVYIIILFLLINICIGYSFIIFNQREKNTFTGLLSSKSVLVVFFLIFYCLILAIAFIFKPGAGKLKSIQVFISVVASFYIILLPLNNKKIVFIFNILISITLIVNLYIGFSNWYRLGKVFSFIGLSYGSTNVFAVSGAVSCALSMLSYFSFLKNNHSDKLISCIVSFNIFIAYITSIVAYSRAVFGAISIMLFYLFCVVVFFKNKEKGLGDIFKLLFILVLILLIFFMVNKPMRLEINNYFNSIYKRNVYFLETARYDFWGETMDRLKSNPDIFFIGENSIHSYTLKTKTRHVHNSFVELIRMAGIFPSFFLFLCLSIIFWRRKLYFFKKNALAISALLMLLVVSFFNDTLVWPSSFDFLLFWAILECSRNGITYNNSEHFQNDRK